MKTKTELFVILARAARTGVIFRRGPSKQVLLIAWDLRSDTFTRGQWLKGRIYERRCDLSPDGDKLIYFAAKYGNRKGPPTWTAVSRPPYLTALAMWPKGDAWGGGGLFEDEFTIALNHRPHETSLSDGFELGRKIKMRPLGEYSGRGEDDPIYHTRLLRDGWALLQRGTVRQHSPRAAWIFDPPKIYQKPSKRNSPKRSLQMKIKGIHEYQGSWYIIDHEIVDEAGNCLLSIPGTAWADWDRSGDLLYAKNGRLFRLSSKKLREAGSTSAKEVADFTDLKFDAVIAPAKAQKW